MARDSSALFVLVAVQSDAGLGFQSAHDQDRILDDARKAVKKAAFFMKKALVGNSVEVCKSDRISIHRQCLHW